MRKRESESESESESERERKESEQECTASRSSFCLSYFPNSVPFVFLLLFPSSFYRPLLLFVTITPPERA